MSTVLSVQHGQFTLEDLQDAQSTCTISVTANLLRYDSGGEFYHVSYSYVYGPGALARQLAPRSPGNTPLHLEIVCANTMTMAMVDHLLMSDEDLAKVSGHICPGDYKVGIMRALALLWD